MRCQDIVLSGVARWAALKVTASKTDIAGRGVRLLWYCTSHCEDYEFQDVDADKWFTCPYHLLVYVCREQHGLDVDKLEVMEKVVVPGGELPFFKTRDECRVTTTMVARFLTSLEKLAPISDPHQEELKDATFGGHSMRRSGAQYLLLAGMHRRCYGGWRVGNPGCSRSTLDKRL